MLFIFHSLFIISLQFFFVFFFGVTFLFQTVLNGKRYYFLKNGVKIFQLCIKLKQKVEEDILIFLFLFFYRLVDS